MQLVVILPFTFYILYPKTNNSSRDVGTFFFLAGKIVMDNPLKHNKLLFYFFCRFQFSLSK
jgi:hypothetical protein